MNKVSKGEQQIINILKREGIDFQKEYVCKDLRQGLYRFDFYLPLKNVLIEYNGPQHYEYTNYFYKNKTEFLKAQERDRRKIAYSIAKQIPLYIIPYWDIEMISSSRDLFQEKYLARTKFHNDNTYRVQFCR